MKGSRGKVKEDQALGIEGSTEGSYAYNQPASRPILGVAAQ